MKQPALLLVAVATVLLATSCSAQPSASPAPTSGESSVTAPVSSSATASPTESPAPPQASSGSISTGAPNISSFPATGAPITSNAKGKPGIATDDQMAVIDKVARAIAAEKYDDAAAAGYYTYVSGGITQDAGKMAELRKETSEAWDRVKEKFDKGCTLVAHDINSSGVINSDVVCKGEDSSSSDVQASFRNVFSPGSDNKLLYIHARG